MDVLKLHLVPLPEVEPPDLFYSFNLTFKEVRDSVFKDFMRSFKALIDRKSWID